MMKTDLLIQQAQLLLNEGKPVEAQKVLRTVLIECQPLDEQTEQWVKLQIHRCYFAYVQGFSQHIKSTETTDNQYIESDLKAYKRSLSPPFIYKPIQKIAFGFSLVVVLFSFVLLFLFTPVNHQSAIRIKSNPLIDNGYLPKMRHIVGGKFRKVAESKYNNVPDSQEVIVNDYFISQFEITMGQYQSTKWPIHFVDSKSATSLANQPIAGVSWIDAVYYCNWLSRVQGLQECYSIVIDSTARLTQFDVHCNFRANGYRLPTANEWEYAASGGCIKESTEYSGGNKLSNVGWGFQNSNGQVKPVGLLVPNRFGLYDMTGNLWEWCWDSSDPRFDDHNFKSKRLKINRSTHSTNDSSGIFRVIKGGSYLDTDPNLAIHCSSKRLMYSKYRNVGFRVVRSIPVGTKPVDTIDDTKKRV